MTFREVMLQEMHVRSWRIKPGNPLFLLRISSKLREKAKKLKLKCIFNNSQFTRVIRPISEIILKKWRLYISWWQPQERPCKQTIDNK